MQTIYNFFINKKTRKMQDKQQVVLTSYSQHHVLQQRMREERLTHGERVTANIAPIRLESNFGKMVMYFCPLQCIEVTERISAGDGGSIPAEAILEGFEIPKNLHPGLYELKNVELYSNGKMQVIANENTVFAAI
jgi:hypothetical protein